MVLKTIAILSLATALGIAAETPVENYDVVIVGGSSAAVGAAIGAGRLGGRVALIEDTPVLGGMLANGICNIDSYSSYAALSGVFVEFRQAVIEHYMAYMPTVAILAADQSKHVSDRKNLPRTNVRPIDPLAFWSHNPWDGGVWEAQVADRIFKSMVARYPNIKVFYQRFASGVIRVNRRVVGVVTEQAAEPYAYAPAIAGSKIIFYGKAIIDASHEADVAAWAGAPYRVGREGRSREEPHAGEIYVQEQTSELVTGSNGREDPAPSGYILRLTVECDFDPKDASHILQAPPPGYVKENYDQPTRWAGNSWASAAVAGAGLSNNDRPANACPGGPKLPHSQAEWNGSEFRNGLDRQFWLWPEATREERRKMYEAYKNSALGYLYFLQHERGLTSLGLTKNAWQDNGNLPYRVFVREARRIIGDDFLTEQNVNSFLGPDGLRPPLFRNSIALVHHPIDAKPAEPKRDDSTPEMLGNGNMYLPAIVTATQIPYGAMLPRRVDGLLVAAALSASHVANSEARQDPMWVVTGQAAGIAAALSARKDLLPRDLPIGELQQELLNQKCKLVFYYDVSADHPQFQAIQRMSLRGIVTGREDRTFRPDEPLDRADAAVWLVKAFDLWPSVTASHFEDVSYKHAAFRAIRNPFCDKLASSGH